MTTADWQEFLRNQRALELPEIDIAALQTGDQLQVTTRHTRYCITWRGRDAAELTTDRDDRPAGAIRIQGCAFGDSSTIKPGFLFCGGNLEYTLAEQGRRYRTTTIQSLLLIRHEPPAV